MKNPSKPPYSLYDVVPINVTGPWDTKSGGLLSVLFSMDYNEIVNKFFSYDQADLDMIGKDIRGLRSYSITDLTRGAVGANEWHRVRNEIVFATKGTVRWSYEDLYGKKAETILDATHGVFTPRCVLHTYEVISLTATLLCINNTVFFPNDSSTHDTYSAVSFRKLQKAFQ